MQNPAFSILTFVYLIFEFYLLIYLFYFCFRYMHEAGNENIYLLLLIISNIVIHDLIQEHRDFYAAPQP